VSGAGVSGAGVSFVAWAFAKRLVKQSNRRTAAVDDLIPALKPLLDFGLDLNLTSTYQEYLRFPSSSGSFH
jgi:hypothetical protein